MEGCDSSALDVGRGNAEGGGCFYGTRVCVDCMVWGIVLIVWYGGLVVFHRVRGLRGGMLGK